MHDNEKELCWHFYTWKLYWNLCFPYFYSRRVGFSTSSLQTGVPNQRKHIFVSESLLCSWASLYQGMLSSLWPENTDFIWGIKHIVKKRDHRTNRSLDSLVVSHNEETRLALNAISKHFYGLRWGKGNSTIPSVQTNACNGRVGVFND